MQTPHRPLSFTPLWPVVRPVVEAKQPERFHPRGNGDGWTLWHSPLRPDRNPSFSIKPDAEDDPGAWLDHATGEQGSMAELARRLGLDPRISLPPQNGPRLVPPFDAVSEARDIRSLKTFCEARRLDPGRLCALFGVRQVRTKDGREALRYPTPAGVDRLKYLDGKGSAGGQAKYRWLWKGGRAHWYGMAQAMALIDSGASDELYIVNGEPSVWACILAGVPAVCLCAGEGAWPTANLVRELHERVTDANRGAASDASA